ncbi:Cytidylate kinase, partial [human gut metagenome]
IFSCIFSPFTIKSSFSKCISNISVKAQISLTASAEERANRRFKELQERNIECSYKEILNDIVA